MWSKLAVASLHWMAEGARMPKPKAQISSTINMGCPARHVTGGSRARR